MTKLEIMKENAEMCLRDLEKALRKHDANGFYAGEYGTCIACLEDFIKKAGEAK